MRLRIEPIRREQVDAAKDVVRAGAFEFFGQAPADFDDMDAVSSQYAAPAERFSSCWMEMRWLAQGPSVGSTRRRVN